MSFVRNIVSKTGIGALFVGAAMILSPMKVDAATIGGQLDIAGTVDLNNSEFSSTGNADLSDQGTVIQAVGDFASYTTAGNSAALSDIDFESPGQIWAVGGFMFTATSFFDIDDSSKKGFDANGILSGNGFDDTDGLLTFSTQKNATSVNVSFSSTTTPSPIPLPAGGLLLLTALGGVAALRRRRKVA